ncbi:MAG: hypothetical protein PHT32_04575 [Candidatus Omnitrophica bacterium]|nr:hypothetical protein [Candidatus Omnitrophota bacterium]
MLLYSSCVHAAISVAPSNIEIVLTEGAAEKGFFTVTNEASESVTVKVEPEDWFKMRLGRAGIPLDKWLTISPVKFDIEPMGVKKVEYVIAPPDGANGEVAAMVYFGVTSDSGGMSITSRNGSSIYVAVAGTFNLDCVIKNVSVQKKKTNADAPGNAILFIIEVENKGDVHVRPTGNINITSDNGGKYEVPVVRGFPAYPGCAEKYMVTWDNADYAPGRYEALITLDYGKIYNIKKEITKKVAFNIGKDGGVTY